MPGESDGDLGHEQLSEWPGHVVVGQHLGLILDIPQDPQPSHGLGWSCLGLFEIDQETEAGAGVERCLDHLQCHKF